MLKSYTNLTGRYLKDNKKRTIFTIIGIILSVALLTAIFSFFPSMEKSGIEGVKSEAGSWHVSYAKLDDNLINKINSSPKVQDVGYLEKGSYTHIKNDTKISLSYCSEDTKKLLAIKIKEGDFPVNGDEIAIEEWVLRMFEDKKSIGDTIKLNIGEDENNPKYQEFKLVGILKNGKETQENKIALALGFKKSIDYSKSTAYISLKHIGSLTENVEELVSIGENGGVRTNYKLLTYDGSIKDDNSIRRMAPIVLTVVFIVIIATIAIIYNAFNISVVQRTKEIGLLRTLGATPKQIKKIIKKEALIISIISIPLGIIFGLIALFVVFVIFNLMPGDKLITGFDLQIDISYVALGLSLIVSIITIYISAVLPGRNASKISPLLAINSRNFIAKENIKKNTGKILKKFTKFSVVMAYKNLKRNKKRYRATVFSIIISIVLTIIFTTFVRIALLNVPINESLDNKVDVEVNIGRQSKYERKDLMNKIKSIDGVSRTVLDYDDAPGKTIISKDRLNKKLFKQYEEQNNYNNISCDYNGKDSLIAESTLKVYDEDTLKMCEEYVEDGKINFHNMEEENGVFVINNGNVFTDDKNQVKGDITNLEVGDEIYILKKSLGHNVNLKDIGSDVVKLKVLGIFKNQPFNMSQAFGPRIIMTPKTGELIDEYLNDIKGVKVFFDDSKKESEVISSIDNLVLDLGIDAKVISKADTGKSKQALILQIKILMYGFVIVIALIGIVNIINTINTSLNLRRKEFAALVSIGMTSKSINRMILLEGSFYGIISSIWGCIIGGILSKLLINISNTFANTVFKVPFDSMIIASLIAIISATIATIPAIRKLKKMNIIETLKEE